MVAAAPLSHLKALKDCTQTHLIPSPSSPSPSSHLSHFYCLFWRASPSPSPHTKPSESHAVALWSPHRPVSICSHFALLILHFLPPLCVILYSPCSLPLHLSPWHFTWQQSGCRISYSACILHRCWIYKRQGSSPTSGQAPLPTCQGGLGTASCCFISLLLE